MHTIYISLHKDLHATSQKAIAQTRQQQEELNRLKFILESIDTQIDQMYLIEVKWRKNIERLKWRIRQGEVVLVAAAPYLWRLHYWALLEARNRLILIIQYSVMDLNRYFMVCLNKTGFSTAFSSTEQHALARCQHVIQNRRQYIFASLVFVSKLLLLKSGKLSSIGEFVAHKVSFWWTKLSWLAG